METKYNLSKTSVGIIEPKRVTFEKPLTLECGESIDNIEIVYETYGRLNKNKDNAIALLEFLKCL